MEAVFNLLVCGAGLASGGSYIKNPFNERDAMWQFHVGLMILSSIGIILNLYIIFNKIRPVPPAPLPVPPAPLSVPSAPLPPVPPVPSLKQQALEQAEQALEVLQKNISTARLQS